MAKKISVGIDIGTHTTRVVVFEHIKGENNPVVLGFGHAQTRGVRLGYINNIKHVSETIKKAVSNAEKACGDITIKKVHVSIGGISLSSVYASGAAIVSKADGEVTNLDVAKALANSEENLEIPNRKIIHVIPVSYKLDGKEVHGRPVGMKGVKLEVRTLFIVCLKQNIEDLVTACAENGLEVINVIASPLATSFVLLSEKQKMAGCALLDIGAETVSLAVFENNQLLSLQVFSIGSQDITKDVALGFRIDLEEAESVKVGSIIGDFPRKKIDEIIEARLVDVFELVENHLKKLKRSGLLPAGIIITGGGSYAVKIDELAKKELKIPARIGPSDATINSKYKIKDASWYTAVGLALSSMENISQEDFDGAIGDNITQVKGFFKSLLSQLLP